MRSQTSAGVSEGVLARYAAAQVQSSVLIVEKLKTLMAAGLVEQPAAVESWLLHSTAADPRNHLILHRASLIVHERKFETTANQRLSSQGAANTMSRNWLYLPRRISVYV